MADCLFCSIIAGTTPAQIVLDTPEVRQAEHILAFIPRDRAEILEQVRRRCDAVSARTAGASVVVEAAPRRS